MKAKYTEDERYYQAYKRVEEIKKFYQHLTVYLLCNPIVIIVNIMTSPGYLWFLYCLLGWGVAIVLHAMKAFNFSPFFNKEWEDRKIREILSREDKKQNWV